MTPEAAMGLFWLTVAVLGCCACIAANHLVRR
ncbi:hypothetical protein SAMN05518866_13758 [Sphingobium sp. YR768]|nr:hypothetical protein SAMN05518866_13758 [Sphingobium sp. YR768]